MKFLKLMSFLSRQHPVKLTLFSSIVCGLISNAFVVAIMNYFYIFSFSPETIQNANLLYQMPWTHFFARILPFPLSLICLNIYLWPVYREIYQKIPIHQYSEIAVLRILNFPLVSSIVALLGWALGVTNMILCSLVYEVPTNLNIITEQWIYTLVLGGLTFVFNFYSTEYISREFLISKLFPLGEIKLRKKTFKVGIRKKIFIFLISTSLLPALIFYRFLITLNNNGTNILQQDLSSIIFYLCLGAVVLSTIIANFKSYSIQKPIAQMIRAAGKIESGNFDVIVPVYSEDEIGDLAQQLNRMAKGLKERDRVKQVFGQAVDPAIRDYLISNSHQMGGEIKDVTVLFCDIEGFTTFSEKKNPKEVVAFLNQYFELINQIIVSEKGHVNKFIGDAILGVFGAPIELETHADAALSAAIQIQEGLLKMNQKYEFEGKPQFKCRIGIHSGEVLAGIVGSKSRMEYTVIGDTVNIAARLEKIAKDLNQSIIISEQTNQRLRTLHSNVIYLNEVSIRGRTEPVKVYRKVG